MKRDPSEIFSEDQRLAAFMHLGAGLAKMYAGLIAEDVPPEHAVRITAEYANGWAYSMGFDDQ